jgi:glutaredoxin
MIWKRNPSPRLSFGTEGGRVKMCQFKCILTILIYRKDELIMSENQGKNVQIYSLSTCSHCRATKKLLAECTVQYSFVDVDMLEGDERRAIIEDVKKFNPKCSFPTIIIGDTIIIGYKEKEIREALGL